MNFFLLKKKRKEKFIDFMNFGYGKPQTNMKYHNAIEKSYYHEKLKNKIDKESSARMIE